MARSGYSGHGNLVTEHQLISWVRVSLGVVFLIIPPALVLTLDPFVTSGVHEFVLGAVAFVFVVIDYFFGRLLGGYDGMSRSPALTLRESVRLQYQLRLIRRRLSGAWWFGIASRVVHAIALAILLASESVTQIAVFHATVVGYISVGLSLLLFVLLWVSYMNAEDFKQWFELEERRELKRQQVLADLGVSAPVLETTAEPG
jgi:hypothetical protein